MSLLDLDASGLPPAPPAPKKHPPSPMQATIYSFLCDKRDTNLMVDAKAGSGKTSTAIEAMERLGGRTLFLAFNKSIAEDIRGKTASGDVKTLNGLGHGLVLRNFRGIQFDPDKMWKIMNSIWDRGSDMDKQYSATVVKAVEWMKSQCHRAPVVEDFYRTFEAEDMGVMPEHVDDVARVCVQAFNRSLETESFDFSDQVFMPWFHQLTMPYYQDLFVDEVQDLNPIQHALVQRLHANGARVIAVGDRNQAIYAFRGALTDSMDKLKTLLNMHELPLSISWRCAQSIIALAQEIVPDIQARPGADEGTIRRWDPNFDPLDDYPDNDSWIAGDPVLFPESHLVICRNNGPLFKAILRHIRAQKPCQVKSDFLERMESFIRKFRAESTVQLRMKLDQWLHKEIESLRQRGASRAVIEGAKDKYETVTALSKQYNYTSDLLAMLKRLRDSKSGPIFSTVHRAKGLEADEVYILRPDLMPSFWAEKPEEVQQEMNLLYVAITRAKHILNFGEKQL
jgi:DNA helicase-2/ATP-dependent DNA helicase PcrA